MISHVSQQCRSIYHFAQEVYYLEPVQKVLHTSYFALGFLGAYNLYNQFCGTQKIQKKIVSENWKYQSLAVIEVMGNLSYLVNGLTSRPGISLLKHTFKHLVSENQLARLFSHHHIAGIQYASFLLGLPATIKSTYTVGSWLCQKFLKNIKTRPMMAFPTSDTVRIGASAMAVLQLTPRK